MSGLLEAFPRPLPEAVARLAETREVVAAWAAGALPAEQAAALTTPAERFALVWACVRGGDPLRGDALRLAEWAVRRERGPFGTVRLTAQGTCLTFAEFGDPARYDRENERIKGERAAAGRAA